MLARRPIPILCGLLAICAVAFLGWDFFQLSRRVPAPAADQADLIRVDKSARTLTLLRGSQILKTYAVALGSAPIGPKAREGDGRTPEGQYEIDSRNARSHFHLALHISYPDANDRTRAQQAGVPAGGDIMVHGLPNGLGWLGKLHRWRDWTDGCIAVTNPEMDEIWSLVKPHTAIEIIP